MAHLIDNSWIEGNGKDFISVSPFNNKTIWQGKFATKEIVEKAIASARNSFITWANKSFVERVEFIERYIEVLNSHKEEMANLIAQETGKPNWEALTEVGAMIGKFAISKQAYLERTGIKENLVSDAVHTIRHKPHGILSVIGPYNFPGHLPNGHIIPALIAGNTIVFKPSEYTPKVAEFMLSCWLEADIPKGVINLIQGDGTVGAMLLKSKDIDGILFTGSYATGSKLHAALCQHPEKILALEMGGNNPLLVFSVQDIDAAIYHTVQSAFITSGQRCTCARRLILPENLAEKFLPKLIEVTKNLLVAEPFNNPEPFMGAVISKNVANNLLAKQEELINKGAKVLLPMQLLLKETGLLTPGILDVTEINFRCDEEIFGPLLQVIRVKDFKAGITEANNTKYGLSAGLISDDEDLFQEFYRTIRAGIINWNRAITGATSSAPFGGIGYSGNHRPSAYYAADYCAYPVASIEDKKCTMPDKKLPGL